MTAPTHVYIVTHSAAYVGKVGIAALDSRRIDQHRNEGWHLYRAVLLPTREAAEQVERDVLRALRAHGLGARMPADRMPQGGHSETVNLDEIPAADLWQLVVAAVDDLQDQTDLSRVVLFLAHKDHADFRFIVVGTDEPRGPSMQSPECADGEELAASGWQVCTANMTAAAADAALRGLREWAAATAGVIEDRMMRIVDCPVPLLRNAYLLVSQDPEEQVRQARIALDVPLNPVFVDAPYEDYY
ncbi:hypothetical protein KNE206_29660 [Kitasatospora sp. NE20-6]|uniref:hypothetical protein n=1 Tax=Kitasatospora sp. NE20-6 TaxID=2859066 RepID=UPI0034DC6136